MRAARFGYFADPPLALAHRGGGEYEPNRGLENTLSAFRVAVGLGYRHLETDVHLSADGVLIAFHDDVLDRVTDTTGKVRDRTAANINAARVGGREPVPTFDQLLTEFPDAYLNVDLKADGTPDALWHVIERHAAHRRLCVGSFSNRRLWRFRRLARGRVATSAGPLGCVALRFLPWAVTRWVHTPAAAYQVPTHVHPLGLRIRAVTPRFVRSAHRLGKQVHVWTVDDPRVMNELLDLGVDGIVSDRIDVLRDVLVARGERWPRSSTGFIVPAETPSRDNSVRPGRRS